MEQQSEQPVQTPEVGRSPDAPDIAAPAAAPRLGGFAAALGNQAFGAWVSRTPVATPARVSLGHPVLARDDKPIVTDRHRALIRSLIINPLDTAGDALDANPNEAMQTSILRRLRAARGAFRSLRFPAEAVARLSASLPDAVLALSGPLGLAPGLRPVHEDVVKALAAV